MSGAHLPYEIGVPRSAMTLGDLMADSPVDELEDTSQVPALDLPAEPRVLLVDDDPLVLARLREIVGGAGYEVRTATDGNDALRTMKSSPSPIVVTDLAMPGMDGLELCRKIRGQNWPGYVYIVMLTVRDEDTDVVAALDAGANDHLSKRASTAQFKARLRNAKRMLRLEFSLKNELEKRRFQAMTDALTGAYNRRYFVRHLGREIKRVQRFGGEVSLLLVDIDHFKQVNDRHGHAAGDLVLQQLTARIAGCLRRSTDWYARLGGEEFGVVLEGTTLSDARDCAERLRAAVADSAIGTPAGALRITISIGVSAMEQIAKRQSATVRLLLAAADSNLYASKIGGRNRVTAATTQEAPHGDRKDSLHIVRG